MDREILFARTLEKVKRLAREQGNCISEEQVKAEFAQLGLKGEQLGMVYDYLRSEERRVGKECS